VIESERDCEVGDCRSVAEQPECIRRVGGDCNIPILEQGAKSGSAHHSWFSAHLSDRQSCGRTHWRPAAGEGAVNESGVEPARVCHREKLRIQRNLSSADSPRQFLRAGSHVNY
jgi:hypothetical protein